MPLADAPSALGLAAAVGRATPWLRAAGLGAVQGLTEFLPVSSSGHLVLAERLFGVRRPGLALEVGLHLGTLVAAAVAYRRDVAAMARAAAGAAAARLRRGPAPRVRRGRGARPAGPAGPRPARTAVRAGGAGEGAAGRRAEPPPPAGPAGTWESGAELALRLALASVPAAVAGALLRSPVEALFHRLAAVAAAWCLSGALLVAVAGRREGRGTAEGMTLRDALAIGAFQALALAPGFSRSGAALAGGLLRGLAPAEATRFAFLLSLPAVGGAVALNLAQLGRLAAGQAPGLWLAAAVACAAGLWAIPRAAAWVRRLGPAVFGWYCLALGGAVLLRAALGGGWA